MPITMQSTLLARLAFGGPGLLAVATSVARLERSGEFDDFK